MHPTPLSKVFWLVLLVLFWAGMGLTGRDAWKDEEALAFGQVWHWLQHGRLPLDSPLYVVVSGAMAWLSEAWLDWQDGARLASGLFTLATLLFTTLTARRLFGPGYGAAAVLLLMGAFGLMLRAHALLPETALMAMYALLLLGLAKARAGAGSGTWLTGLALAGLVLARGVGDGLLGLVLALGLLLMPGHVERGYRHALPRSILLAAFLLAGWLAVLTLSGQLATWWSYQLAGLLPTPRTGYLLSMLVWFAWPAWPLAAWTVWHEHRKLGRAHDLHLPLLATLALFLAAHLPALSRDGAALPMLLPLSLLAAHGMATVKRGAAQAFYWFGVTCFLFFAIAFWVYFAALEWQWPPGLARHMARLVPGYISATSAFNLGLAGGVTLLWLLAVPLFPRAKLRPALVWASGMALTWTLLICLYRPWIEAGWSYRPVVEGARSRMPGNACVTLEVEPAARIVFSYHLGPRVGGEVQECEWRLVQGSGDTLERPGYQQVWRASRPRGKGQVFWLLRRD